MKPATVIGWHRKGFGLFWTWKIRSGRPGRPAVPADVRSLIRAMSFANPLWGAPRIRGELLKLGIAVGETSVSKYMVRHRRPPSQTWRTFVDNHIKTMVSVDFLTVATIRFEVLYVFQVLAHDRRRILHSDVAAHPTAEWTAQQLRQAFPWDTAPRYLLRDRDRIFGKDFVDQMKAMGMNQVLSAPRSPWQRAYVERVIGTIRRECLDQVIVVGKCSLYRHLQRFVDYYHRSRTHLGLEKDTPEPRSVQSADMGRVIAMPEFGGLHHRNERRAAYKGIFRAILDLCPCTASLTDPAAARLFAKRPEALRADDIGRVKSEDARSKTRKASESVRSHVKTRSPRTTIDGDPQSSRR